VSGIPVIRSVNFCNDGSISTEDIARIQPSTQNTQDKRLRKGDILLERSGGGPKQPVGRVVLFDLDEEFYFGNFISRLRCKPDVDSSFLFFQLFNIHMKGGTLLLQDQTTGIRNLRFTEYLQLPIALPSLSEQKRIAAKVKELMAEVEHARTACEKQLEAAKALPQAILRKAFKGEV
jgi:type I restriction enzyme S subunit